MPPRNQQTTEQTALSAGLSQLSLVEHALCPLDIRKSLQPGLVHESSYRYTDANGKRQLAQVCIECPRGLSAADEFYLWGLLALTLAEEQPSFDFYATPHYCLRQLGVVGPKSKGGKNYRLFRESLRRLAAVRYQSDHFYDPVRKEHRRVDFGMLSYSLPLRDDSSRAWRIVWDPVFFEFCQASGGRLRFDLDVYRRLDPASRRLLLLLTKVFWRRRYSPWFDVRELAVQVLGVADTLPTKRLKEKVERCASVLAKHQVITMTENRNLFLRRKQGVFAVRFERGPRSQQQGGASSMNVESPLWGPLQSIGLDRQAIRRILKQYPHQLVRKWSDVTLAAMERKGNGFFRKSPAAHFVDNLKAASRGERGLPDWFLDLQKQEQARFAERARKVQRRPIGESPTRTTTPARAFPASLSRSATISEMTAQFIAAGQSETDAKKNAHRFVAAMAVRE